MKLYHLVCMDNNRKIMLYSLCVWKITVKRSWFTLGLWTITDKWSCITLDVWTKQKNENELPCVYGKIKNKSSCILMGVWKITNKWSCVPLEISTIASLNSVGHEILSSFIIDPYDNRHMKLYYLLCMDNNRKMVLYSRCVWNMTVKWSCIILGV